MVVVRSAGAAEVGVARGELLAAVSLAIDLGLGQPMEHMLRSSLIATTLADRLGLGERRRGVVFYTTLVAWIGCHADSHELARWFGDDIAFRSDSYRVDWAGPPFLRLMLDHAGRNKSPAQRAALAASLFVGARDRFSALIRSHCTSAGALAQRMGLDQGVQEVLAYTFERWDGGGLPLGVRGDALPVEMRVVQLADVAEVHLREGGVAGALAMARSRRGTQFDPAVVEAFEGCAEEISRGLAGAEVWTSALQHSPDRDRPLTDAELDDLLEAMGDFADLKCPFMIGHSRGVAALAAEAGRRCGLPASDVHVLRRAGWVHDLGRMGVPNSVWGKAGPLSQAEQERVRLHPYLSGRILARVPALRSVAALAAAHHERQDGSGYPQAVHGLDLSPAQRLLAAADVYCALRQPRPHRPEFSSEQAVAELRALARGARLDPKAVQAVLDAAGQPARRRTTWPGDLTAREVEVLRLVARGMPNRAIGQALHITEKTARNHVEHIYTKLDVSNRTGASLYALRHGLIDEFPGPQG